MDISHPKQNSLFIWVYRIIMQHINRIKLKFLRNLCRSNRLLHQWASSVWSVAHYW